MSATTHFDEDLDLDLVAVHPNNPRRRAQADDELVDSVKASGLVQPLIVAPHPDDDGRFRLIAGHRRLDALRKSKRSTAPAVIRVDLVTDGQQLEAMLVENGRRQDLTPIEEAEGYQQLTLFGYKPKDIAKAVGRSSKTVSSRLKLLQLQERTQTSVHTGQLTLEDALAITEFDPHTQATLEKASGTAAFRYELEAAQRAKVRRESFKKEVAGLERAAVPEFDTSERDGNGRIDLYALQRDGKVLILYGTVGNLSREHGACLAWHERTSYQVTFVCTDPESHKTTDSDEAPADARTGTVAQSQEDREEWERRQEERRARLEAAEISKTLRRTAVLEQIKPGIKLDKALTAAVKAMLIPLAVFNDEVQTGGYFDAVGVDENERPAHYWSSPEDFVKVAAHQLFLDGMSDYQLARGLVALLIDNVEWMADAEYAIEAEYRPPLVRYFDHLASIGHHFTEIDTEIHARALGHDDEADEDSGEDE